MAQTIKKNEGLNRSLGNKSKMKRAQRHLIMCIKGKQKLEKLVTTNKVKHKGLSSGR